MNSRLRNRPAIYAKLSNKALVMLAFGDDPDVAAKAKAELDRREGPRPVETVEAAPWWAI